jgi:hypothetical protein
MKKLVLTLAAFALVSTAVAQYQFYGTTGPVGQSLGGVALADNGDVYYVTFGAASSLLVHIPSAVPALATNPTTGTVVSTESLPSGRGLNDVEVDAAGNVYINGTGGAAADTVLKKFGPAPAHTLAWSMQALDAAEQVRINGIGLMDADTLAISKAWNIVAWKNTSDGLNKSTEVSGGGNYQRSLALNTANNDIYAGKNGASTDSSLKVFSGGSLTNLTGYTFAAENFLNLGWSSAFGGATQAVAYDAANNRLVAADIPDSAASPADTTVGARIYNITGSGAGTNFSEVQFIAGREASAYKYAGITGVSAKRITTGTKQVDFLAVSVTVDTDGDGATTDDRFTAVDIWAVFPTDVPNWPLM